MKKSLKTLLTASVLGLLVGVGLNMITVKTVGIGPDGYEEYRGFPFQSCVELMDSTNRNNSPHCSYGFALGNVFVGLLAIYGVYGNIYFFREVYKKKS